MNKTAIKNFAIWARNKLISDVCYRAGLMGITADGIANALPQSTGTTEFYDIGTAEPYAISGNAVRQRKKLIDVMRQKEKDTNYQTAYKYIMEEVAYTWFNRLIAVRFMEVNDYLPTHVRVLSSESGKQEPDLVTNPFDVDFDYSDKEKENIVQMKQDNSIDELFRLLFIKQCNELNNILPALFEKTSDYTELLLNLSIIDQDGVVYHLVNDIDEDDFNVDKGGQVEIIGWLYQYYNTEPKNDAFAKKGKITKEEVPAVTQLFTPDWIVRYMVENSLGRLWLDGHPNDLLKSNWKYYLDEAEQEPEVEAELAKIREEHAKLNPEDIKLIDPCMGSGHILVYAFDVLMQIYESAGWSQRDAAKSILENNIYGLDIDDRAGQMAYFAVMMKARQYNRRILSPELKCNISTIKDSLGIRIESYERLGQSLSSDEYKNALSEALMIVDEFKYAKEYGSMIKTQNHDWDLLQRFAVEYAEESGQQFLDVFGDQEAAKRIQQLCKVGIMLSSKYDVVVTNPPYMSISNASKQVSDFVKKNYSDEKTDLYAVFINRCNQLTKWNGYQAMITQQSWMFLSSFEQLRYKLLKFQLVNMVHLGARAFEEIGGEVVQTTSFVINKRYAENYIGSYVKAIDALSQKDKELAYLNRQEIFYAKQDQFGIIPGAPFAYWMSDNIRKVYEKGIPLGKLAAPRKGNSTSDNARFLRLWTEVDCGKLNLGSREITIEDSIKRRWYPYNKGGGYRKWYGNNGYMVDWYNDAAEIRSIKSAVIANYQYFMKPGLTWSTVSSVNFSIRWFDEGFIFDNGGCCIFDLNEKRPFVISLLNSSVFKYIFGQLNPTLNFQSGEVAKFPIIYREDERINQLAKENVIISKKDWDISEISWDFKCHPLRDTAIESCYIKDIFETWKLECEKRYKQIKNNEEELNRIFIDIYGLNGELFPSVDDGSITISKADVQRDIKSLISYAVGCMFGRYSLDFEGLAYAGGEWDASKYTSFTPDEDNIIPITDEEYLEDDIVAVFCAWLKVVYGRDTLEENLDFIAKALGNKGSTSREIIRNYFLNDFFSDHCTTYSVTGSGKRPIYWLFDSGKQNGFKALVYLHRYNADTIGNLRVDYLHRMQRVYESEMNRMQDTIDHSSNNREIAAATKRKEKLQKQLKECREYDEKVGHLALSRIELDLDDGVKVNYRKVQTGSDGQFYEVLADSKKIMTKK